MALGDAIAVTAGTLWWRVQFAQVARIFDSLGRGMAALLEQYSAAERQVVAHYLEHTIALLNGETVKLRQDA